MALFAVTAHAQPQGQSGGSHAGHTTPGAARREPWPLRPDPSPGLEDSRCPPGAHYLFRVGGLTLRLGPGISWGADPVERRPPTWMSDLPGCGDGRAIGVTRLYLYIQPISGMPPECWAAGVPPRLGGPACADTPDGMRAGRRFFALGLPYDISIRERTARDVVGGGDDRLSRLTIRRRTPLGNEEFRAPLPNRPDLEGGSPTYRLPRIGEGAEALGPLLVECWGVRWPDPPEPGRVRPASRSCHVTFDAPHAGVRVRYRFPREVYDEPDWQALDLRVREWIAARTAAEPAR